MTTKTQKKKKRKENIPGIPAKKERTEQNRREQPVLSRWFIMEIGSNLFP